MERMKLHVLLIAMVIQLLLLVDAQETQLRNCSVMDLAFLLDSSGSICDSDLSFEYGRDTTCNNYNYILRFVYDLVNALDIGPDATRVGLVTFATGAKLQWNLTAFSNKADLLNAILRIPYSGGVSDTTDGLRMIRTGVFSASGDRPSVPNICIIITDGRPLDPSTVPAEIDSVHSAGIRTIVVGISDRIDEQTLQLLSSPPHQLNLSYFTTTSFSTVGTLTNLLLSATACVATPTLQSTVSTRIPDISTTGSSIKVANKSTVSSTTPTSFAWNEYITVKTPSSTQTFFSSEPNNNEVSETGRINILALIVGLAIGIPLVLVIIILSILLYRREKKQSLQHNQENTNGISGANNGVSRQYEDLSRLQWICPIRQRISGASSSGEWYWCTFEQ